MISVAILKSIRLNYCKIRPPNQLILQAIKVKSKAKVKVDLPFFLTFGDDSLT